MQWGFLRIMLHIGERGRLAHKSRLFPTIAGCLKRRCAGFGCPVKGKAAICALELEPISNIRSYLARLFVFAALVVFGAVSLAWGFFDVANLACDLGDRRVPSCYGSRALRWSAGQPLQCAGSCRHTIYRLCFSLLWPLLLAFTLPQTGFLSILCVGHAS
jgi:hypothetical protein